ncbi:MAG: accessory factor UbiK family protein [Sphingomonadales bacterium]
MAERNPLFEDFAKVAASAMTTFGGLRDEAQAAIRARMEDMLADMDFVTREEFDAVRAMALKAREENEKLFEEIKALKAKVTPKSAAKPAAKPRATTKRAPTAKKATAAKKPTPRKRAVSKSTAKTTTAKSAKNGAKP